MSKFSERFRQLKEEKQGMTLKELSAQLDISVPNLSYYMKGREPNYDTLIKIADYFNVTVDWLIGRTDARNETSSSIISEVEKHLESFNISNTLTGAKKELYLNTQEILFDIMSNTYVFLLSINEDNGRFLCNLLAGSYSAINQCINEVNLSFNQKSKDTIITMIRNEETLSDVSKAFILFFSYSCAQYLSQSDELSKHDQDLLKELINFCFCNFKQRYPENKLDEMISSIENF